MLLITESTFNNIETLVESAEYGKKKHYIEGVFMAGGVKNRNGRLYPVDILETETARYNKDLVESQRAVGELGHPDGPTINMDRVSHLIVSLKREGNDFVGKARVLDTPMGKILKTFIDEGVRTGVSTRGLGSVKQNNGIMEVQKDFHLATIDSVQDPSGPNCFVNGIMENTEYYYDLASGNYKAQEQIEETVKEVRKKPSRLITEADATRLFAAFIETLK